MRGGIAAFIATAILGTVAFWVACSRQKDASGTGTDAGAIPELCLNNLNSTMAKAREFRKLHSHTLDSLRKAYAGAKTPGEKWKSAAKLSETYRQSDTDSAIHYADIALSLAPRAGIEDASLMSQLLKSNSLATAGVFSPALQILDSVAPLPKSREAKISFWMSQRMLHSYMLGYLQDNSPYAREYRERYLASDDSLLAALPRDDKFRIFISGERLINEGKLTEASRTLEPLLESLGAESNLYGMTAFQLAEIRKRKADFKGYAHFLALAAESDIKSGVKEGMALPVLANWLYDHGDLDNAFRFINFALEDANTGNVRMRTVTIAELMPVIDEAYRAEIDSRRNAILAWLIVAVVFLLVSAILLVVVVRNIHRMHANERKLKATSRKLEAYVGNFIGLCSNYAARLDQLTGLVNRKISSGQADELLKLVNSGKFVQNDNEDFYRLIDKALLDLFPDFVESINTLLLPDKRIELKEDAPLTPELRIYAFVRLGVDQSSKIAQILNYSVNTVYAYRNRLRARAADRENFDSNVASLGAISI